MEWIVGIYVGIGVYLAIMRTANPANLTRWMHKSGSEWYIGFCVHSLAWPLTLNQAPDDEGCGFRPFNWASKLGVMFLPKRRIWVNAFHPAHPQGHYRFQARVPLIDIAEYAENDELVALRSDNLNLVGCASRRPRDIEWILDIPGIGPQDVEWYFYIPKHKYAKYVAHAESVDDALRMGNLSAALNLIHRN